MSDVALAAGRIALEWAIALTVLAGAVFYFGSALGLVRLPDFYTRVHSPAKAATLGTIFLAFAALLNNLRAGIDVLLGDLLLILFLFLTSSVTAQVLMRAAVARGVPADPRTTGEPPASCEHVEETGELARKLESDGRR